MSVSVAGIRGDETRTTLKRGLSVVQDALLIGVSALFFYSHGRYAIETHNPTNVFFAAEQALLIGMFLSRRRTHTTSQRPWDWFIATIGGWAALAMRPHDGGRAADIIGGSIQIVGLLLLIVCFLSIGKSFGVVAANRGLKVHGPYRIVRHPIYFAHAVTQIGFIIANPWWPNIALFVVITVFQLLRIQAEERVLSATSDYEGYRARVRWRLLPGLV